MNVPSVVQEYIDRPLLIDGYKFDLRVYVLVTSCDPLRIYLFQEGLVRLCTQPYQAPTETNLASARMHLTNYAINKVLVLVSQALVLFFGCLVWLFLMARRCTY